MARRKSSDVHGLRPFHERVTEHIKASKLTAAEIAELAAWSERKLARMMSGKTHWRAEDIEKLATILEKPVTALFRDRAAA